MKKSIQIIATAFAILLGNVGFSQNDTMYVNYGGNVTIAIPTSQIDSLTFYRLNITPSITDADGNVYTSVTIGTQEWMVENLRTSKYSDGTSIPNVIGKTDWSSLSTGAWSHYDNDSSQYESMYGKLYNWYAVETGKLCPTGWHVPTDAEWTILTDYLTANGHNGTEGDALKATSGWASGGNGTDNYGWLGLPGGNRGSNGSFDDVGNYGYWWSSSQYNASYSWPRFLNSFIDYVYRGAYNKEDGFSVRCLRYNDGTHTTSQVRLENGETPLDIYQSGVPIDSIIGKTYQGGLIAYLDTLDGTGLIAAPTDQGTSKWGCYGTLISGADGTAIGTGSQNTADILAGCSETNIAAYLCDTLTLGGYNDWFLPSKDELNKLYENIGQGNALGLGNVGGFANPNYWSSTENDFISAWFQYFSSGLQYSNYKYGFYVRAVRAF